MSPLNKEFTGPSHLSEMDRRDFMKYLGLFGAMSVLSACSEKAAKIVPFTKEIAEFSGNTFEYYTSAVSSNGFAQGILVKSFEGRPIKIEGNPLHPYSLGATTPITQAAMYDLYHPDRIKDFEWKGKKLSADDLCKKIGEEVSLWGDGTGVAIVMPHLQSPTYDRLLRKILKAHPKILLTSMDLDLQSEFRTYDLTTADVVISFDEDLFQGRPDELKASHDFMKRRTSASKKTEMNELIVFQSSPTLLGAKADKLYVDQESEVWKKAQGLLEALSGKKSSDPDIINVVNAVKSRKAVVAISRNLHPEALVLESKINQKLSRLSQTVHSSLPFTHSKSQLKEMLRAKRIKTLILLQSDPLYQDSDYKALLGSISDVWSLSLYENESVHSASVKISSTHFLEEWRDLKAMDGGVTIAQPLIRPLHQSLSLLNLLKFISLEEGSDIDSLKKTHAGIDWDEALRTGIATSDYQMGHTSVDVPLKKPSLWNLKLLPDPYIRFGEGANNPLLMELPRPFSRITWRNAALISDIEARELKVIDGDVIQIKTDKGALSIPVFVTPLLPKKTILINYGFGSKHGTFIAKNQGVNVSSFAGALIEKVEKTSDHVPLARSQTGEVQDSSLPVKSIEFPIKETTKKPEKLASFYPENPLPPVKNEPKWGMTIDLTACIGCESCVLACQVENNVPFVGEDQVLKSRIMHWIRIDTYHDEMKKVAFQPIPCMHCEKAPCEVVCPVNATIHGEGGLNEMVYNRCVGTRYCSNNCPYKVRRFNFKAYSTLKSPWNLGFNPDVSVRDRGVMEKCTFCVQRIKSFERDGTELRTACQQVCPTKAIEFADLRDEKSLTSINKKSPRNYDLLEEEGTIPRVSYLKVMRLADEV